MQLSSRILTALAVLILAVAVVAVRAGSTGTTVEAATGTIDVLNVGTCYTNNSDVFAVGDCDSGDRVADADGNLTVPVAYDVAGRDAITEVGTVYATYAHDPKTAPDSPRAVLVNSNLVKISITDSGRDKRTPVLYGAGDVEPCDFATKPTVQYTDPNDIPTPTTDDDNESFGEGSTTCATGQDTTTATLTTAANTYYDTHLPLIQKDFPGIAASTYDFRWDARGTTDAGEFDIPATNSVVTGIAIWANAQIYGDQNNDGDTNDDPTTVPPTAVDEDAKPPYRPMYVVDGNDSPISIYGSFDINNDGDLEDAGDVAFMKLNKYLKIDEDVGSGRIANEAGNDEQEVAPWFSVRVEVPNNGSVEVMYVVYETSEFESLVGGATEGSYSGTGANASVDVPAFTKTEKRSADTKLVVEARSDGRDGSQNLSLRETSRFSGRYEGYLKLTDENGIDPDSGKNATNWGMNTADSGLCTDRGGCTAGEAAILGVESGPVVIAYKDTDGNTKLFNVAIDTVPPTMQVDQPEHNAQIQDLSPEFSGSYSDSDSGLRKGSFRAYVDHQSDPNENGVDGDTLALNLRVNGTLAGNPYGQVTIAGKKTVVESHADYAGYAATATGSEFGVVPHDDVFDVDVEATGINNIESIGGDAHDDGATNGTFGDSVRIDFNDDDYNDTIDFQALVADVAGNIGFSDSDAQGPRFINHFGEKSDKRKAGRYNVLGWYARHIFFLDEVDPKIFNEQSVTGFYGHNDDDKPNPNRSGILVAFDRAVDGDSIDVETFTVTLDPTGGPGSTGVAAQVVDVDVQGREVYLLLGEELASDATPAVDIATGKWVSDPAGNRLTGGDQQPFDVKDGISPKLTVTLSGGSGTGEGDEGPAKLTKNSITVTIATDEEINSTPSLAVVCSNIGWDSDTTDTNTENDKELSDLVKMRSGGLSNSSADFTSPTDYDCGTAQSDVSLQQVQSYSRPGLEWEYQWVNFSGNKMLEDGKLTVVAYARDRQSYASLTTRKIDADPTPANTYNWGAGTAEFRYDKTLVDPNPTPGDGDTVTEIRPFVLLAYDDKSTVSIDEFKIDGTVQTAEMLGGNRFLYWPDELALGSHDVAVKAVDAAGNEDSFEFSFKSAERKAFGLKLIAGWNAVSLPANPIDPMIESVFTDAEVDMVAGWDASDPAKPWSIATRMEGEWSTNEEHATLNKIHARYGYWVHSKGFITQRVKLVGGISRTDPEVTPPDLVSIPTLPGWNFVGVIDQDGDQTQDDFGEDLMNNGTMVKAGDYLGSNKRAYTWDPIRSKFDIIASGDALEIGDGIWVYYGGGIAP